RPVFVVGAKAGDRRTRQFWVDQERLVFVRLLEPGQRDTASTGDIRFNQYRPVGAAWLAAEVAFLVDGRQRWLEQYTEIKTDRVLTDSLFDPRRWPASSNPAPKAPISGASQRSKTDQIRLPGSSDARVRSLRTA